METRNASVGGIGALSRRKFNEAYMYKKFGYLRYMMDIEFKRNQIPGNEDMQIQMSLFDRDVYEQLALVDVIV